VFRQSGDDTIMEEQIMKIAVAGATGRVGRHVSEVLAERGHEVVAMSRASGVDIITGAGLDAALNGVEVIVDAATGPSPEQQPATEFFVTRPDLVDLYRGARGTRAPAIPPAVPGVDMGVPVAKDGDA
jgi:uncharacterized protein YbjT (DUF2867 family)